MWHSRLDADRKALADIDLWLEARVPTCFFWLALSLFGTLAPNRQPSHGPLTSRQTIFSSSRTYNLPFANTGTVQHLAREN